MSGLPSWARVGAKVVCVTEQWGKGRTLTFWRWLAVKFAGLPIKGGVYVVTEVGFLNSTASLRLRGWGALVFPASAFRPLVTLEDDISTHFRQLLDVPAHHGADA